MISVLVVSKCDFCGREQSDDVRRVSDDEELTVGLPVGWAVLCPTDGKPDKDACPDCLPKQRGVYGVTMADKMAAWRRAGGYGAA